MEPEKTPNIQSYLMKNNADGIILPDFKIHYKDMVNKTVQCCPGQTYRPMEQNRDPRNNSHIYGQLIFNKGMENMQCRKDSLFTIKGVKNWILTFRRLNLMFISQHMQKTSPNGLKI